MAWVSLTKDDSPVGDGHIQPPPPPSPYQRMNPPPHHIDEWSIKWLECPKQAALPVGDRHIHSSPPPYQGMVH